MTINILPDDTLICVFDFYLAESSKVEAWCRLVHVCRRWQTIVFGSPRRLNLRIACTDETSGCFGQSCQLSYRADAKHQQSMIDNIKAALEHHDRVCQIKLNVPLRNRTSQQRYLQHLEATFPVLTDLKLESNGTPDPFLPNPVKFLIYSSKR